MPNEQAIRLIIVYGVNKPLEVTESESIDAVKLGAMKLFDVPEGEQNQYVLKTKIDGKEEQLDEARSVEFYRMHNEQKVTLAAGTPFGQA